MQISDEQMRRLRWRCRRGLLENDLVLQRFLESRGHELDERRLQALNELLEYPDTDLWDIISGRAEVRDNRGPDFAEIAALLRDA